MCVTAVSNGYYKYGDNAKSLNKSRFKNGLYIRIEIIFEKNESTLFFKLN